MLEARRKNAAETSTRVGAGGNKQARERATERTVPTRQNGESNVRSTPDGCTSSPHMTSV